MKFKNIWLIRANEKRLLQIVQWAQKQNRKVESIKKEELEILSSKKLGD